MTSSTPRITVVVPAFNEPKAVLEESLRSVALQTLTDFECIVVDESTQPEAALACREACAKDPRFVYVHPERRLGLAASLNLAIGMARAPLVARFDSDDVCMPDRLQLQMDFMEQHPEVGVLGGGLEIMDEHGRTLAFRDYAASHHRIERQLHTTTPLAHPTVMFRKQLVERAGGYNPAFKFAEDLDLWLRLLNTGVRFANLPQVLVRYRQQSTRRNPVHWQFNLRARTGNFRFKQLHRRLFGIAAVAVWGRLPASTQQRIFHGLLLRRR